MIGILIHLRSAYVRLALRVYFTTILTALSFVGDACCKQYAKLRLRQARPIALPYMTGWLSTFSAISTTWSFRTLPSSWLGFIMILSGILWVASDLSVSTLVTTVDVVSRCHFNTTDRYFTTSEENFNVPVGVTNAGYNYDLLKQAKAASLRNGGITGIFKKVNNDLRFRADSNDIHGQWSCQRQPIDYHYSSNTSMDAIVKDLQSMGALFTASAASDWHYYPDNSTSHLVALSASGTDQIRGQWTVKAAVDVALTGNRIMQLYACDMDAPSVDWVLSLTMPQTALLAWNAVINENIYSTFDDTATVVDDPGKTISSSLDDIITLAGVAWNRTESHLFIEDPSQGCLDSRASVPVLVVVLVTVVALVFGTVATYWLALSLLCQTHRMSKQQHWPTEEAPTSLLGWMQEAVRVSGTVAKSEKVALKNWYYHPRHVSKLHPLSAAAITEEASPIEVTSLRPK